MLFVATLSTVMIPLRVILILLYQVVVSLGIVNSLWGMIVPRAVTPTAGFLLRQYVLTIPDELIEAARIDGASNWRIFWQLVPPLARPALAVHAIFSVTWRWNDLLWPLITAQDESTNTLPPAIAQFSLELVVPCNLVLAMSVFSVLPVIVMLLFLQPHIVTGIAQTGLRLWTGGVCLMFVLAAEARNCVQIQGEVWAAQGMGPTRPDRRDCR
jgi:alpha-1,4-digalacturonate transport system permease protein